MSADAGNRVLVIECVVLVQQLKNPTEMYDILEAYLPENLRRTVSTEEPTADEGK